jgi:hypothetical protein
MVFGSSRTRPTLADVRFSGRIAIGTGMATGKRHVSQRRANPAGIPAGQSGYLPANAGWSIVSRVQLDLKCGAQAMRKMPAECRPAEPGGW